MIDFKYYITIKHLKSKIYLIYIPFSEKSIKLAVIRISLLIVAERNERCLTQDDVKYMNTVCRRDVKFVMLHWAVRIIASEI